MNRFGNRVDITIRGISDVFITEEHNAYWARLTGVIDFPGDLLNVQRSMNRISYSFMIY